MVSSTELFQNGVGLYFEEQESGFKQVQRMVTLQENLTSCKVNFLRTDNGLEYCSNEFSEFCKSKGIARHLTVPGTPKQNGLAKRMNRTILERVRCMLSLFGLSNSNWVESVVTACYLINMSPSVPINFLTPIEKWSGKRPDLKHLRVFGCKAYAHVKLGKLDVRDVKCVFIGYPEGVK